MEEGGKGGPRRKLGENDKSGSKTWKISLRNTLKLNNTFPVSSVQNVLYIRMFFSLFFFVLLFPRNHIITWSNGRGERGKLIWTSMMTGGPNCARGSHCVRVSRHRHTEAHKKDRIWAAGQLLPWPGHTMSVALPAVYIPEKKRMIPVHSMFFYPNYITESNLPTLTVQVNFSSRSVAPFSLNSHGKLFLPFRTATRAKQPRESSFLSWLSMELHPPPPPPPSFPQMKDGVEGGREEEKTFLFALAKKRQKKERVEKERVVSLFGPKLFSA